ncbi:MAG: Fe-S cluster assembly protein SufD [Prevotella sp.]|nr:Fe-S cluster assembly protein SufD [Prevotella sp.]
MFRQYIDLYNVQRELLCRHSAVPMNACREQALGALCGWCATLPTALAERFRYTPLRQLMQHEYGLNLNRLPFSVSRREAFRCGVPGISDQPLLVVNDQPDTHVIPDGRGETPRVCTLRQLAAERPDIMDEHYARAARPDADPVTALNTLLAQDGLAIIVPNGVRTTTPLQVINLLSSPVDMMVNRRVLIIVEPGASAQLLFCDHIAGSTAPAPATPRLLTTQVIETYIGEGASLDLFCMEETGTSSVRLSQLFIEQQRDSHLSHNIVTLQNGLTRNQTDVQLLGPGAEAYLGGCVIADGQQHVDNNTLIRHAAPHCDSRELYKYVLDGKATGAFAGRVLVEQGAQKTTSKETNQNLCASDDARMYTQPMLEIYADDVKCSHGSTVGQLNDQALFYMQQRGIPLAEARTLLQMAFLDEVIDGISIEPLRQRLHHLVDRRFHGQQKHCDGCQMCS